MKNHECLLAKLHLVSTVYNIFEKHYLFLLKIMMSFKSPRFFV